MTVTGTHAVSLVAVSQNLQQISLLMQCTSLRRAFCGNKHGNANAWRTFGWRHGVIF